MSEQRIPDAVWRFGNALSQGKKTLRIELFKAEQWRAGWRPYKNTMTPHPPLRDRAYWSEYYRLRVDGRWHGKPGYKFSFYTLAQAVEISTQFLEIERNNEKNNSKEKSYDLRMRKI